MAKRTAYRTPEQQVPKCAKDLAEAHYGYVGTEEKAILDLASEYQLRQDGPRYVSVSWANQVRAYEVFKAGGLIGVLAELFPKG